MKKYSYLKRRLLRELSEDSRISVTELASKLKCSRNTIAANIKMLEDELDLHYTIEFNKDIFVFQNQVWSIKLDKRPTVEELKKLFKDDQNVQFVAKTSGDFDLIINIIAESSESYVNWGMRTMSKLLPYNLDFEPSHILLIHGGLTNIPNSLINNLSLRDAKLDELDKKILTTLSANSRLGYNDIAKQLGEDVETVRYRTNKILARKIIRRFTVIARKPPTPCNVAFLMKCKFAPGVGERYNKAAKHYLDSEDQIEMVNKFQYLALTSGSYILFGLGCFESEDEALRDVLVAHKRIYRKDNPTVLFGRITDIIKGELPIRNMDFRKEYKTLNVNQ